MFHFFFHPFGLGNIAIGALAWAFAFWTLAVIFNKDLLLRPRGFYFLYLAALVMVLWELMMYPIILIRENPTKDYQYLFFEYLMVGGVMILAIVLAGWHRSIAGGILATMVLFGLSFRYEILDLIAAPIFDPDYGHQGGCGNPPGIPTSYFPLDFILGLAISGIAYLIALQQQPRTT